MKKTWKTCEPCERNCPFSLERVAEMVGIDMTVPLYYLPS